MNEEYIRPEKACELLKVTVRTLFNWNKKGKIKSIKTKGGHHRYLLSDILNNTNTPPTNNKRNICYCRVSTSSQKEDLERQVIFFKLKFPNHEIIKDIGSGINFKRKGFNALLDESIKGNIGQIVVTHKDRLCRFGFELVERIIRQQSNGEILVLNKEETSPEKELVNDLISIITVFSSRLYGLRSHSLKNKIRIEASKNFKNQTISE
jgi:predicted site-specific integrase-resolvase